MSFNFLKSFGFSAKIQIIGEIVFLDKNWNFNQDWQSLNRNSTVFSLTHQKKRQIVKCQSQDFPMKQQLLDENQQSFKRDEERLSSSIVFTLVWQKRVHLTQALIFFCYSNVLPAKMCIRMGQLENTLYQKFSKENCSSISICISIYNL